MIVSGSNSRTREGRSIPRGAPSQAYRDSGVHGSMGGLGRGANILSSSGHEHHLSFDGLRRAAGTGSHRASDAGASPRSDGVDGGEPSHDFKWAGEDSMSSVIAYGDGHVDDQKVSRPSSVFISSDDAAMGHRALYHCLQCHRRPPKTSSRLLFDTDLPVCCCYASYISRFRLSSVLAWFICLMLPTSTCFRAVVY